MEKYFLLILILLTTSCASGTWSHVTDSNSNLEFDKGYCRSLANSKSPTRLCRNPFYCEPDEWSETIVSIAKNNSTFDHCMYKKGYKYE
tara:strand:+ start:363 stop:629 length:267 start_codon:yes stop_codon:yes gene_type:complete